MSTLLVLLLLLVDTTLRFPNTRHRLKSTEQFRNKLDRERFKNF